MSYAAIEECVQRIRTAPEGYRNETLSACAFELAAARTVREIAYPALRDAALAAGLDRKEIRATFESGWGSGLDYASAGPDPAPVPAPSPNVFANVYNDGDPQPVGTDNLIRLGGPGTEGTFDVSIENGELRVNCNGIRAKLAVLPRSENSVLLRIVNG